MTEPEERPHPSDPAEGGDPSDPTRGATAPRDYRARSSRRRIFPLADFGTASMNSTWRTRL
jgi:hypothetical protein